jgi:hypothetical protein
MPSDRHVRAVYSDRTITVYQAYSPKIADAAVAAGTFVSPFKRDRMTWIKPSFLWMMYRSGWATKPGQERVLAIEITREGFEWALAHSCLSHFDRRLYSRIEDWEEQKQASPVRVQWDPERSITLEPLPRRAIQIGLSGPAVERYVDQWIVSITDVTSLAHSMRKMLLDGDLDAAKAALPDERIYPLPDSIRERVAA